MEFKKIYIEITNNCNMSCEFCPKNDREKRFITVDNFKILLDKLEGYTKYLYFHVMGEPLLHPEINNLISLASFRYNINITTNGYLINRIKFNKQIRQINISLHSFNPKIITLEKYMDTIFDAVDNLKENTYISYRLWVDSENKAQIIKKIEDKYKVNINDNHIKLDTNVYYDVEEEFIWPNLNNEYYSETGTCLGLRKHIGILTDGTVVPCCLDNNGQINLGNIYEKELPDILNTDKSKKIKEGFINNKKVEELCKHCSFYDQRRNTCK